MVLRIPRTQKALLASRGRIITSDSRLGRRRACLNPPIRVPYDDTASPQIPKRRVAVAAHCPDPLAGAVDGPSPSLAHASPCPAIATCFLPSSIFHSHPSPTPADSTTLNPVSTLPSFLPSPVPPPFQPLRTNTPHVTQLQHPNSHLSLLVPLDAANSSFVNAFLILTAFSPALRDTEQAKLTSFHCIVLCTRTWHPPVITLYRPSIHPSVLVVYAYKTALLTHSNQGECTFQLYSGSEASGDGLGVSYRVAMCISPPYPFRAPVQSTTGCCAAHPSSPNIPSPSISLKPGICDCSNAICSVKHGYPVWSCDTH